ncbi:MAG: sirohydrochlorin chelatase, partial [Vicinamibacterales bacterium]
MVSASQRAPRCFSPIVCGLVLGVASFAFAQSVKPGVLLLAHGGAEEWNARVLDVAKTVDGVRPTEVAFGMASRRSIQGAIDRLAARGVTEIVAVPLFVSSWSSVITATEYLLGVRAEAPAELAIFAKMNHGALSSADVQDHSSQDRGNSLARVTTTFPIRMTEAFNHHPLIGGVVI